MVQQIKVHLERYRIMKQARLTLEKKVPVRITQSDMARMMGKCRQTYNCWERGNNYPSLHEALILAKYFDCKVDDLFEISDNESGDDK